MNGKLHESIKIARGLHYSVVPTPSVRVLVDSECHRTERISQGITQEHIASVEIKLTFYASPETATEMCQMAKERILYSIYGDVIEGLKDIRLAARSGSLEDVDQSINWIRKNIGI